MGRWVWLVVACVLWGCSSEDGSSGEDAGQDTGAVDTTPAVAMPFTIDALDEVRISSHGDQENFQNAIAQIDLGEGPFREVTLIVELGTTCFPFESWQQNPPPEGENWPADCDAFDRNFEVVLDPAEADGDSPGVELIRAITPFGGPMTLEENITDIANALPGAHTLKVHITTWSDGAGQVSGSNGGWTVSARLEVVPGPAPREVVGLTPLLDASLGPDRATGTLSFDVPEGAARTLFHYRATGHGGAEDNVGDCIGPAEEFCRRRHTLEINGNRFFHGDLWREDCQTYCTRTFSDLFQREYCAENPTGSIQSVEAPRANWCPGAVTPPLSQPFSGLEVGPNTVDYAIEGVVEGGSWRTSAWVIHYAD